MGNRSISLDALRGIAIILMVFSSRIPFGVLPEWMYHAQVPPPAHVFNPAIPGITWVDLVFPFFLFSMGAAIPLALQARLDRGDKFASIAWWIIKRGALLLFFAIYVKHIQPYVMATKPDYTHWLLALFGFAMLFPMLSTLPAGWTRNQRRVTRALGWCGALLVLMLFRAKDGTGFSVTRSDIIILVLANVAVSGSFLWLWTRDRLDWRLGLLTFLLALRLTQSLPGWGQWTWNLVPKEWAWIGTVYFQQYLFIIVPGTIVGDLLLRYQRSARQAAVGAATGAQHVAAWIGLALCVLMLVGMLSRMVVEASIAAAALCALGWWQLGGLRVAKRNEAPEDHPAAQLLKSLFGWGAVWLMLGLAFEPFEGGIKKDRATLSYYFVTSGLAFMLLVSLRVALEHSGWRRGWGLVVATGQNPLVAYAGVQSLVPPLLALTGVGAQIASITATPWLGALRGAFYTWLTCWVAAFAARRGWLLKT
jgi:predicted acyltransferase